MNVTTNAILVAMVMISVTNRVGVFTPRPGKNARQNFSFKVGVNPSLKREMWLLMDLITKKICAKMYKSIHFWNQKNQMNPMVATDLM